MLLSLALLSVSHTSRKFLRDGWLPPLMCSAPDTHSEAAFSLGAYYSLVTDYTVALLLCVQFPG